MIITAAMQYRPNGGQGHLWFDNVINFVDMNRMNKILKIQNYLFYQYVYNPCRN